MLQGLGFKNKHEFHVNENKELVTYMKNDEINKRHVNQKKASSTEKRKIKNKQDRWEHLVDFSEKYITIFGHEIKSFYKENPEIYKNDCLRLEKQVRRSLFGSIALLCSGFIGIPLLYSAGLINQMAWLAFGMSALSLFGFFGLVFTAVHFSQWKELEEKGSKNQDFGPWDFMGVFECDANLSDVWEAKAKEIPDFDYDKMYSKNFKKKPVDLNKINSFQETKRWLARWSRGNIENLHKIEWQALVGMIEQYEEFLTPVHKSLKVRPNASNEKSF